MLLARAGPASLDEVPAFVRAVRRRPLLSVRIDDALHEAASLGLERLVMIATAPRCRSAERAPCGVTVPVTVTVTCGPGVSGGS
jgi:hypothetical protein